MLLLLLFILLSTETVESKGRDIKEKKEKDRCHNTYQNTWSLFKIYLLNITGVVNYYVFYNTTVI